MKLTSQIEISAQVWVCDSCGVTDHKSCSCRATAHSEELKKKKEQDRQRAKAYRDRAASRDADIESTKESGEEPQRLKMPSKAEADASEQNDLYDHACILWERMTPETREKFRTEYAESEGTEPTQHETLASLLLLWNAATETTRTRFLRKVEPANKKLC
jgi:hypothetical protein